MPISLPDPPDFGRSLVAAEIEALGRTRFSESGGAASLAPVPVFTIDAATLADHPHDALSQAHQTGWRYVVFDSEGVSMVEVDGTDDGLSVMGVVDGGAGQKLLDVGSLAEAEVPENVAFEARILDLRAVAMTVFWLHDGASGDLGLDMGSEQPTALPIDVFLDRAAEHMRAQASPVRTFTGNFTEEGG